MDSSVDLRIKVEQIRRFVSQTSMTNEYLSGDFGDMTSSRGISVGRTDLTSTSPFHEHHHDIDYN